MNIAKQEKDRIVSFIERRAEKIEQLIAEGARVYSNDSVAEVLHRLANELREDKHYGGQR